MCWLFMEPPLSNIVNALCILYGIPEVVMDDLASTRAQAIFGTWTWYYLEISQRIACLLQQNRFQNY